MSMISSTKTSFITAVLLITFQNIAYATPIQNVFINEIHYDNDGADTNEFVELAGEAGINLKGWSLHFYNGSNGTNYKSYTFGDWLLDDITNGFDFAAVNFSGIQNGAPDGVALADNNSNLIQFLSYEGNFEATNGIALGLTSINIGVEESSSSTKNFSLQLTGIGNEYKDFTWEDSSLNTFANINNNQNFIDAVVVDAEIPEPNPMHLLLLFIIIFLGRKINTNTKTKTPSILSEKQSKETVRNSIS